MRVISMVWLPPKFMAKLKDSLNIYHNFIFVNIYDACV